MSEPRGRTIAGALLILLLIGVWAVLVASLASFVGNWPVLVQALFYLIVGIAWIFPAKPILRWSQTGRWRAAGDRRPVE